MPCPCGAGEGIRKMARDAGIKCQDCDLQPIVEPVDPSTLTLKDFGWAPGGYTIKCVDCPKDIGFMENGTAAKRAWRCEKHAQQRLDEAIRNTAPAAGAPKTTVDG